MSDKKKIGALWTKQTKAGKTLLTGNVEVNGSKVKVAVFENIYKQEGSRQPDYVIYEDNYPQGAAPKAETPDAADFADEPKDEEIPF